MVRRNTYKSRILTSIAIILSLALVLSFAGCGNKTMPQENDSNAGITENNIGAAGQEDGGQDAEANGGGGEDVVYDYNDLPTVIAGIPDKKALNEMYILLEGYWTGAGDLFFGFIKEDGGHWIEYGLFQTEFWVRGKIVGGQAVGKYEAELIVNFPAVPANEMNDGRPETTETIFIDLSGLSQDGKINIKGGSIGDGSIYTYAFGGSTLEDAFNNR